MLDPKRLFVVGSFVASCTVKVDRFPLPGESLLAHAFLLEAGGKGFNLMAGARRLGLDVDGVLMTGADLAGRFAEQALAEADLPPALLHRLSDASTGGGVGFTDALGENCLAVHPGANMSLTAGHMRALAPAIRRAALVAAQFEAPDGAIAEAFFQAREAGVRTFLNPSPYRPVAAQILARTSILVINRTEAKAMADDLGLGLPEDDPGPLGMALIDRGLDLVVITLGAAGAVAFRKDGPPLFQAAYPIACVDSLGAGDAFSAGLIAGMLNGLPLPETLSWGCACGAIVASSAGVFRALPTTQDVQNLLAAVP